MKSTVLLPPLPECECGEFAWKSVAFVVRDGQQVVAEVMCSACGREVDLPAPPPEGKV